MAYRDEKTPRHDSMQYERGQGAPQIGRFSINNRGNGGESVSFSNAGGGLGPQNTLGLNKSVKQVPFGGRILG